MENLRRQFKISVFTEIDKKTEDFVTIDLNRVIKTELVIRDVKQPSVIEGVELPLVRKRFLEVTFDEYITGSEPIPTKFDKQGQVTHSEPRKYEKYNTVTILDEEEIEKFLSLVLIN